MAPVKRSAAAVNTTTRATRTTRAASVAKKQAAVSEKKSKAASPVQQDATTHASETQTRRSRKTTKEDTAEPHGTDTANTIEVAKPTSTRTTRATATTIGLAAAPRRRIKVTPLDASVVEKDAAEETTKSTRSKIKEEMSTRKKTTRSKSAMVEGDEVTGESSVMNANVKTSKRVASKAADKSVETAGVPKVKGRPKSSKAEEPSAVDAEPVLMTATRTTRSKRAESNAVSEPMGIELEAQQAKPTVGVRKKVTFQDMPAENDKENQPFPQAKSKRMATKQGSTDTVPAKGLRAKPVRKAASATTSGRVRKVAPMNAKSSNKDSTLEDEDVNVKRMPTALTPKKITQVARSSSPEREEQETSEGEDELNGGKTPIRDLSVSPRRPTTAALARAMSPAKRLDFGQSLVPKSPDKIALARDLATEQTGILGSPARRPAASPFKDAMKDSPKRGLVEGAKLLFPYQHEQSGLTTMNASVSHSLGQSMSTLLQSPKRATAIDPAFFSQSAMKKSVTKSPFKSSLFSSPARRLFSPLKKSSVATTPQNDLINADDENKVDDHEMEIESEISASSHFRSSLSPLRVMRVEPRGDDMDFDDSVLQVRSPLKIHKSPLKTVSEPVEAMEVRDRESVTELADINNDDVPTVEPVSLDIAQDAPVRESEEADDELGDIAAHRGLDTSAPTSNPSSKSAQKQGAAPNSDSAPRPSLSQVLFRSNRATSDEESSEDELAGGVTPLRSGTDIQFGNVNDQPRSRLSSGVPPSASSKGFGFTPLAAQMSSWLAASPEKHSEKRQDASVARVELEFSPLARQHIDGEIMISRDSTPAQKFNGRTSLNLFQASNPKFEQRRSLNLRRSVVQRQSMGLSSVVESPARNAQFDEYMEIRALEEQAETESLPEEAMVDIDDEDLNNFMTVDDQSAELEHAGDTILEDESEDDPDQHTEQLGDLTTDLINFTHASDTAMVDFKKLAEEADELASDKITPDADDLQTEVPDDHDLRQVLGSQICEGDKEHIAAIVEPQIQLPDVPSEETSFVAPSDAIMADAESPILYPTDEQLESPSILVIDQSNTPATSPIGSPSAVVHSSTESPTAASIFRTPKQNLELNERRMFNTVVSKVPLKPEGSVSPIKVSKKRSRSFGTSDTSPAKRISLENLRSLRPTAADEIAESPNRRVRTSVAPSPGGTSTPATIKSAASRVSRHSLGVMSTPGQISFCIDDFGDSTLDGFDLPDDYEDGSDAVDEPENSRAPSTSATPRAVLTATPATSRKSARRATTPATTTKKTPKTATKTSSRASMNTAVERTPLVPVGRGVLHGATVFVDVHTSEGADASGIFIELLNQMGAKCVKEWRWNPRASLALDASSEIAEQRIGITHVVYKDGGKRTLEKVRDAKGEVCCVGVSWVLDCERENKWLDESSYAIDASILPRGGSNRRKSMEPRALLVGNDGSVSASRPRRSVSAEMNELMKRQPIQTPARGQDSSENQDDDQDDENDENVDQATPTGFISYDPRTAMTPGTPYLISQGKKLTQMSAPPKQQNKSLFEDEDEENDDTFMDSGNKDSGAVKDAKKFRMRNLGDMAKRRRTLGFKPMVRSPLGRH